MSNPVANKKPEAPGHGGHGGGHAGGSKRHKKHPKHEDATPVHDESNWLVSYADMMTLLFGFFVLMYSFSKIDEKKFEIIRKDVARYFGGQVKTNPTVKHVEREIDEIITQAGIDKNVQLIARDSELELRFNGSFHFVPGTAQLTKESDFILGKLIDTIKRTVKADSVTVEGHTDDNPIASEKFPSNWELSAARASTVVRQFERFGFDPTKMTATGFGSSRPLVPNRDSKGEQLPENQEINRRVIVNIAFNRDIEDAIRAMKTGQFSSADAPEALPDKSRTSLVHDGEGEPTWREKVTHDLGAMQDKLKLAEERLKETEARKMSAKQLADLQGRLKQIENRIDTSEVETKKYVDLTNAEKTAQRLPASVRSKKSAVAPKATFKKVNKGSTSKKAPGASVVLAKKPVAPVARTIASTPTKAAAPVSAPAKPAAKGKPSADAPPGDPADAVPSSQ
jgi:chemotaxis protein MotB